MISIVQNGTHPVWVVFETETGRILGEIRKRPNSRGYGPEVFDVRDYRDRVRSWTYPTMEAARAAADMF